MFFFLLFQKKKRLPKPQFFEFSSVIVIVGTLINMAYLSWRNKVKKRPGVRTKLLQKYAVDEKENAGADDDDGGLSTWIELGDRHPDFVYTL